MKTQAISKSYSKVEVANTIIVDLFLLAIVYFLPAISHHFALPLYMLDPMRIVIFTCILLTGNKTNSFIMAATIPLFSFYVGGHPVLLKSILIGIELIANVGLFWLFFRFGWNVFAATLLSIISAKLLYYFCKILVVKIGWLQMEIVSTSIIIQLSVALFISLCMCLLFESQKKKKYDKRF